MPAYPTRFEIRAELEASLSSSKREKDLSLLQDLVVLTYEDGLRDGKVAAYFELEGE